MLAGRIWIGQVGPRVPERRKEPFPGAVRHAASAGRTGSDRRRGRGDGGGHDGQQREPGHTGLVEIDDAEKGDDMSEESHPEQPELPFRCRMRGAGAPCRREFPETETQQREEAEKGREASCITLGDELVAGVPHVPAPAAVGVGADQPPVEEVSDELVDQHGPVKTDHILFIASGAFHIAKPSDLLPELQGRLPIRVELQALTRDDFRRILTEPEASLIKQYVALLATEGVTLDFTGDAIDAIANIAVSVNSAIENIGARRLQTVMERVLDEISFAATDRAGETVRIDAAYVDKHIGDLAKNADLSRFIL